MKVVEKAFSQETTFPEFNSGDTITVHYKIIEGNKERIQQFKVTGTSRPCQVVASALDLSTLFPNQQIQFRMKYALGWSYGHHQVSSVKEASWNILIKKVKPLPCIHENDNSPCFD